MSAQPPVIVLGGDTSALSVARSLGSTGVTVHGIGVVAFAQRSRFLRAIPIRHDLDPESAWARCLLGPATEHLRGAVVLATSDVGLLVLARHRERLLGRFRLDESDVPAQLAMLDKLCTYQRAREADVPTPRFWQVDGPGDLERYRGELVYPLIVKPLLSHEFKARFPGIKKFRVVANFAELLAAYRELDGAGVAVMLVEKIPGSDEQLCSYATYLDPSGNPTYDFTKRVIRRFPPNEGLACYHVTDHNREVKDLALALLKHVGLRGVASVEFIRDVRDGQLKLVECNARFSAANPLVAAAGLDLAQHVYSRILGRRHDMPVSYPAGLRMIYPTDDVRAFLALRRTGELTAGRWVRSLAHRQTFPVLRLDDPAPAFARAVLRVAKLSHRFRPR